MIWRNLTRKSSGDPTPTNDSTRAPAPPTRPDDASEPAHSAYDAHRLAGLQRQRQSVLYDIEQGELAASSDNPWTHRIKLLTEAIATVEADRTRLSVVAPGPWFPVPSTAIHIRSVGTGKIATVSLEIGGEEFVLAEEPDWAEGGHELVRPDLLLRSGDLGSLIPVDTPTALREPLRDHLVTSLIGFATDLRDRSLDAEPLPQTPTLADLARACPICGGWTDWRGQCQNCAHRAVALAALHREAVRLLDERNFEADQQHKLAEGLHLAQRRLQAIDTEIARITS